MAKIFMLRMVPFILLAWAAIVHAAPYLEAPDLVRDPMKAPAWASATAEPEPIKEAIALSAIVYRAKGATAVINGQRVQVGDSVAGATLIRIEPQRVQIQNTDGRQWLSISAPESIKVRRR